MELENKMLTIGNEMTIEKKINKEESTEVEEENKENEILSFFTLPESEGIAAKNKTIGIYGDLDEEAAASIVYSLMTFGELEESKTDNKEEEKVKPIKLIVSTNGGVAHEMFAIYDIMRMIKQVCEIETIGLGKVMSAGVVVLAAGTKGKRKIGKNCRVMIHPVNAASYGDLKDIENETREMKYLQKMYIHALIDNTNMKEAQIKRLLKKKVNIYLSAEEAIKYGIADEII